MMKELDHAQLERISGAADVGAAFACGLKTAGEYAGATALVSAVAPPVAAAVGPMSVVGAIGGFFSSLIHGGCPTLLTGAEPPPQRTPPTQPAAVVPTGP